MRKRHLIIVVAICALFAAGCKANGATNGRARTVPQETASGSPRNKTDTSKRLTEEQLRAALLTINDMPTGFTLDATNKKDSNSNFQGCEQLAGLEQRSDTENGIDVSFTKGGFGPFVSESLGQKTEQGAKDALDKFANAFSACKTVRSIGSDGKAIELKLSPLSFPKLGDDTFALRMSGDAEGITVGFDVVVIRRSGVMILILNAGIGSPDSAITETVARKALEKVDKVMA
jgi:predicted small secreted protein